MTAIAVRKELFERTVIGRERVLVAGDQECNAIARDMPYEKKKFAHGKG